MEKRKYSQHADRFEYVPTEAGMSLFGLLQVLRSWGDEHARSEGDDRIALRPFLRRPPLPARGLRILR
ncbi:winged helix-turn-helix transcriptional regulator [Promicromonospora sp. NPDC090134]|uniref:winged helix-turn-helix transcriptional regulator n=1 Tax=Promicromonospora sp. NPDC090134 TaxID=3364408 RepID=UPI0037FA401D